MQFEKNLTRLGNSYAIIIDRPICNLLQIRTRTVLNVSTDGRRIIIEPTNKLLAAGERIKRSQRADETPQPISTLADVNRQALQIDIERIWWELRSMRDISLEEANELWHEPVPRLLRFGSLIAAPGAVTNANDETLASIMRFVAFWQQLNDGIPRRQAIADALATFPKEQKSVPAG